LGAKILLWGEGDGCAMEVE